MNRLKEQKCKAYLKAKDTIYVFDIIRKKSSEFEDGVPKRPE